MSDEEFSDRFLASYTRFISVASISIFVSVLELSPENSFFGFKVTKVDERWVETAFFGAALMLGGRFLTRMFDEVRVLRNHEHTLRKYNASLKSELSEINELVAGARNQIHAASKMFEESKSVLEKWIQSQTEALGIDDTVDKSAFIKKIMKEYSQRELLEQAHEDQNKLKFRYPNFTMNFLFDMPDRLQRMWQSSTRLEKTTIKIHRELRPLIQNTHIFRIQTFWSGLRFWFFEVIISIFLLIVMVVVYLLPNEVPKIFQSIGEIIHL